MIYLRINTAELFEILRVVERFHNNNWSSIGRCVSLIGVICHIASSQSLVITRNVILSKYSNIAIKFGKIDWIVLEQCCIVYTIVIRNFV